MIVVTRSHDHQSIIWVGWDGVLMYEGDNHGRAVAVAQKCRRQAEQAGDAVTLVDQVAGEVHVEEPTGELADCDGCGSPRNVGLLQKVPITGALLCPPCWHKEWEGVPA